MRSIVAISTAVVMSLVVGVSSALRLGAYKLPTGVVPPTQWPQMVQFRQDQYNTILKNHYGTLTYYDANSWQMRNVAVANPDTDGTLWNGTDLYMFNKTPLGESCQKLDMGFGIPLPDWFLTNSTATHTLYQAHKYNLTDEDYHKTLWTRKYSVPDTCGDCGPDFNYYSVAESGQGFKLEAPSPFGEMVNELTSWETVSSFPTGLMGLPAAVNASSCINAGDAHSFLAKLAEKVRSNKAAPHERTQFGFVQSAYTFALHGGNKKQQ